MSESLAPAPALAPAPVDPDAPAAAAPPPAQAAPPSAQANLAAAAAPPPAQAADANNEPVAAPAAAFLEPARADQGQRWVDLNLASAEDMWSMFCNPNINGGCVFLFNIFTFTASTRCYRYLGKSVIHSLCTQLPAFGASYPGQVHLHAFASAAAPHLEVSRRLSKNHQPIFQRKSKRSSTFAPTWIISRQRGTP
jgi:hypothetical protein